MYNIIITLILYRITKIGLNITILCKIILKTIFNSKIISKCKKILINKWIKLKNNNLKKIIIIKIFSKMNIKKNKIISKCKKILINQWIKWKNINLKTIIMIKIFRKLNIKKNLKKNIMKNYKNKINIIIYKKNIIKKKLNKIKWDKIMNKIIIYMKNKSNKTNKHI